jgi:hypothetical protein
MLLLLLLLFIGGVQSATVTCYGHVFVDVNGNGIQESFELNAQGQTLHSSEGQTVQSNAQGNFAFTFADPGAGGNFTIDVPEGGVLTTPPATRPAWFVMTPCVFNTTGLMNIPGTTLNTGQVLTLSVFGGLLGAVWLSGVVFIIYQHQRTK